MIYLDHAAATPLNPQVLAAQQPFFAEQFYNPSATYLPAKKVRAALEEARASVAAQLGAKPSEIIFTAGGTEANNLAIHGVMRGQTGHDMLVSAIEHDSVMGPAFEHNRKIVQVKADGIIDMADLQSKIGDHTMLISIMYANNEVGSVQPIKQVAELVRHIRSSRQGDTPLYLHVDACQAANYLDLHVSRLGVDLMTLNGGKIYGPKQSGVLYVSSRIPLKPIIEGGGQERGLRSGTENVAACVGFAKALELAQDARKQEVERLTGLQQLAFKRIAEKLPNAVINGSLKHRLPNNLHLTFPGQDNERLLLELEQQDILAAAGSACSASDEEPSHVLRAMGLSDLEAQSSLRFTMGRTTTEADVITLVDALANLVN